MTTPADKGIAAARQEGDFAKQIVAKVLGQDVTHADMEAAFARVRPARNWKEKIDATVRADTEFERESISQAVTYFTGSIPTIEAVVPGSNFYRVRAAGYYLTIGS